MTGDIIQKKGRMNNAESPQKGFSTDSLWIEIDDRPRPEDQQIDPIAEQMIKIIQNWLDENQIGSDRVAGLADALLTHVAAELPKDIGDESFLLVTNLLSATLDDLGLLAEPASQKIFDFVKVNAPHLTVDRNTDPYHVSVSFEGGWGSTVYFDAKGQWEMGLTDDELEENV